MLLPMALHVERHVGARQLLIPRKKFSAEVAVGPRSAEVLVEVLLGQVPTGRNALSINIDAALGKVCRVEETLAT